jgi:error-prone DNA polymerase
LRIGMTANVISYRGRSAAREVGKALSLDVEQIDRLAKVMNHFEWVDPKETLERNLRDVGIDHQHPTIQLFGQLWVRIQDLPRHLGQHSGGMVLCQGRLDEIVPLENASMPDRVVVQWDKDDCADMGLVKVDLLGLGMMAVLQDALTMVNRVGVGDQGPGTGDRGNLELAKGSHPALGPQAPDSPPTTGPRAPSPDPSTGSGSSRASSRDEPRAPTKIVDLAHLPPDDPEVYKMLQEADTVGIFQVESRAQMATLPRLRPQRFYDIVVEVAIIRPGPIVGQMVHPYLKRRQGSEPVVYPHPSLEPILARTLGVPLFQEQLLRMAMVAAGFTGGEAEELRRAMGFKRSEKRMKQIEEKLRAGMARQGITGDAAEQIIRSIASFALYGFPESHAASFALLVYASAYLKAHYPAAFFTAMLNNQPMGFYHPATLVKDAQRHGVRFSPIDVQLSDWECRVEPDGRVRLGLMYVNGLRQEIGKTIAAGGSGLGARPSTELGTTLSLSKGRDSALGARVSEIETWSTVTEHSDRCPKCGCDDQSLLEETPTSRCFCNICAHEWSLQPEPRTPTPRQAQGRPELRRGTSPEPRTPSPEPRTPSPEPRAPSRYQSIEDLIARTNLRRDELATLAEIGALNSFGYDRRSALWQIERAIRPSGELFEEERDGAQGRPEPGRGTSLEPPTQSPLRPMTPAERLQADYAGTSLTVGPHPMALCRGDLALRGVLRARDLSAGRHGRRVRVAGAVITRQRPGTAKGFVFLTLEDETGIANIIVRPDLFSAVRTTVVGAPYLLVEGTLQIQEGVTSVKAERVFQLPTSSPDPQSHDFR